MILNNAPLELELGNLAEYRESEKYNDLNSSFNPPKDKFKEATLKEKVKDEFNDLSPIGKAVVGGLVAGESIAITGEIKIGGKIKL